MDEVLARAEAENVKFVNLQFTDVVGIVKSVTIPVDQLRDALKTANGSTALPSRASPGSPRATCTCMPDLRTFAIIPWERGENTTARIICWVYSPKGELFPGDPRAVLQRASERGRRHGLRFNTGPEVEFFLFGPNEPGGSAAAPRQGGYFDFSTDLASTSQGDGQRAGAAGDYGRDQPPRGAWASTKSTSSTPTRSPRPTTP